MKRLLLLALVLGFASTSFAQFPRKVLMEEFTNTGCPPCAATDPNMDRFEAMLSDKLVVLKYHVSWPDPNDPFYKAQTAWHEANYRGQWYYRVTGVPDVRFAGKVQGSAWDVADLQAAYDQISKTSPFKITVNQEIVGDSIYANVTVNVSDNPGTLRNDIRLAVVFAERFNPFVGTNKSPHHSNIVRKYAEGLSFNPTDTGAVGGENLTFTAGETKTFRVGFPIGTTWKRDALFTAAFLQSVGTKEVYQAEWTVPTFSVELAGGSVLDVKKGTNTFTYKINNPTSTPMSINVAFDTVKGSWAKGWDESAQVGAMTVPANGTSSFDVTISSPDAIDFGNYTLTVKRDDGYHLATWKEFAFGFENKNIIVDAGAGVTNANRLTTAVNASGTSALKLDAATFASIGQDDWSRFKTIIYSAGTSTGLYSNTGDWDRLSAFLESGGNFALTSTAFVTAYANSGNETLLDNVRNTFGIEPAPRRDLDAEGLDRWTALKGVAGDAVGNGVEVAVSGQQYETGLWPVEENGAKMMFTNENEAAVASRRLTSNGKVALFTFGLESITTAANRNLVVQKLMDWFNGVASVKVSDNATDLKLANYPNPFNPSTKIEFTVTERVPVTLVVRDMMGREVATLVDFQMHDAGTYAVDFDAANLTSGTYVYELTAGAQKISNKMTLNK